MMTGMRVTLPLTTILKCSCAVIPASAAPAGALMQPLICATSPSSALCVSVAARPVVLPRVGSPPAPVVAPREFSLLMSSAAWSAALASSLGGVLACSGCFLGVSVFFGVTSAVFCTGCGVVTACCNCDGLLAGIGAVCVAGASADMSA